MSSWMSETWPVFSPVSRTMLDIHIPGSLYMHLNE